MSAVQLFTLAGLLLGAGVVLGVRARRPEPPSLAAAASYLSAAPEVHSTLRPVAAATGEWLPAPLVRALSGRVGVSDADLDITGTTRAALVTRKVQLALGGFLSPTLIGVFSAVIGIPIPIILPAGVGLVIGAVLWFLPSQNVREDAAEKRRDFRSNLEAFIGLVAGERIARGSVDQALEEAAALSDTYAFRRMRYAIRRSSFTGAPPWQELAQLAQELEVPELFKLANDASAGASGAMVYDSLLANAETLSDAELNDLRTTANTLSERMSRPLSLLVGSLTLFILIPFVIRVGTTITH